MRKIMFVSMIVLAMGVGLLGVPEKAASKSDAKPIIWGAPCAIGTSVGRDGWKALSLAVEEINKNGGIKLPDGMHPIKLETMDSRSLEPGVPVAEALLTMERLIMEKKADFIIGGPERTEAGLAAMDMSNRYKKIIVLGTGNCSPRQPGKVAKDPSKYPYVWLATPSVDAKLPLWLPLFDMIRDKWGFKKFYILTQDVSWGRGWGKVFSTLLPKRGWEKVGDAAFPLGSTDFSSALLDAKKKGADIFTGGFDMPESAIMMKQWAALKVPTVPVCHISPGQPLAFWKATAGKCEYSVLEGLAITSPRIGPWAEKYMKWCSETDTADGDPIHNYCAAYCLKEAIEIAGSLDSDAVSKAFLKVDIKDSPYGRLRFNPKRHQWVMSNDPKEGAVVGWFQWQDGKRVHIYPEPIVTGDLKLPAWRK
ncbi:MAG: ABC transporter substrate-binding protein [Thermodesulfobacteriota bacterium]|nr:ABC transporter substrate-binding protein [Thermodesulfobacteriota bacterium]